MVSESMDRQLPLRKRLTVYLHRLICVWCDRYYRQLHLMRDRSKKVHLHLDDVPNEELTPGAKAKIKRAMHGGSK